MPGVECTYGAHGAGVCVDPDHAVRPARHQQLTRARAPGLVDDPFPGGRVARIHQAVAAPIAAYHPHAIGPRAGIAQERVVRRMELRMADAVALEDHLVGATGCVDNDEVRPGTCFDGHGPPVIVVAEGCCPHRSADHARLPHGDIAKVGQALGNTIREADPPGAALSGVVHVLPVVRRVNGPLRDAGLVRELAQIARVPSQRVHLRAPGAVRDEHQVLHGVIPGGQIIEGMVVHRGMIGQQVQAHAGLRIGHRAHFRRKPLSGTHTASHLPPGAPGPAGLVHSALSPISHGRAKGHRITRGTMSAFRRCRGPARSAQQGAGTLLRGAGGLGVGR